MKRFATIAMALALFALAPASNTLLARAADGPVEVDIELVLAVDVSRSMNADEMALQRRGYAAALTDGEVVDAITGGLVGQIAVAFLEWAGDGSHHVVVPWRLITGRADAARFSEELTAAPSFNMQYTSISGALLKATQLFENNGYRGLRRVIDISGDGPNNQGVPVDEARDLVIGSGITINGLPLMTAPDEYSAYSIPDLDVYYIKCVIGGPGSFSLPVRTWSEFPEAIRRKIVLELAGGRPVPPARILPAAAMIEDQYDCQIGERRRMQMERVLSNP